MNEANEVVKQENIRRKNGQGRGTRNKAVEKGMLGSITEATVTGVKGTRERVIRNAIREIIRSQTMHDTESMKRILILFCMV